MKPIWGSVWPFPVIDNNKRNSFDKLKTIRIFFALLWLAGSKFKSFIIRNIIRIIFFKIWISIFYRFAQQRQKWHNWSMVTWAKYFIIEITLWKVIKLVQSELTSVVYRSSKNSRSLSTVYEFHINRPIKWRHHSTI